MQECAAGLIPLRRQGGRLAFAAPPLIRSGLADEQETLEIAAVLGLERTDIVECRWIDNGPGWVGVLLNSAEQVLAVEPSRQPPRRFEIGVVGPHAPGTDCAFELRAFFSDQFGALREDPVTGSLNASVAQWLFDSGRATAQYVAAQGTRLGCAGRVYLEQGDGGAVWVGGATRTIFSGEML